MLELELSRSLIITGDMLGNKCLLFFLNLFLVERNTNETEQLLLNRVLSKLTDQQEVQHK
jgi:hypothetical protein